MAARRACRRVLAPSPVTGFAHTEVLEMVDLALYFGAPAQKVPWSRVQPGRPGRPRCGWWWRPTMMVAPAFPGGAAVPERANFTGGGVEMEHGGGPALVVFGRPGIGSGLAGRAGDGHCAPGRY